MALKLFSRDKAQASPKPAKGAHPSAAGQPSTPSFDPAPREDLKSDLLERLLQQKRYNVIQQETQKWEAHPRGPAAVRKAQQELEASMALVPAGSVTIPLTLSAQPGAPEQEIEVEPFLLESWTVTNARFQHFVDDGAYDQLEYWPEEIWPHLIELKDLTGEPGPRFWQHGRHDRRLADHPVVGISWYEAQAFALWIGQRLPSEAEWQMAASWHINSSADLLRRFPWGDAMDNTRCNIWSSRQGDTVPVTAYPKGGAPNQVLQLVGNVWEWTDTEYNITDDEHHPIIGEMPMHAIRGGAFDTYFETQATSQFRTGQIALARMHNIGFRCAMDLAQASWINNG
ncbi:MAG: formylglycine-generating enzyme family protein [Planctomycetes bacterium]|nr:formylglycine-generating enzyme family protein [Planctomycetota bacterium]